MALRAGTSLSLTALTLLPAEDANVKGVHGTAKTMCLQSKASWMRDFPKPGKPGMGRMTLKHLTVINSLLIEGFYIRLFLKFFDHNP